MIFTMTVPLLEIIGHTYTVYLKKKMEALSSLYDSSKAPLTSTQGSVSISIQPLGPDDLKLELPQIKSKLVTHNKRLGEYLISVNFLH